MKKIFIMLFLFLNFYTVLDAQQISFQMYNDYFAGTDKLFTNGIGVSWLDNTYHNRQPNKTASYSKHAFKLLHFLHLAKQNSTKNYTAGISLSQIMITPPDTSKTIPQYNHMPYAGYLGLSMFAFKWDENSYNEYRITFGVVGHQAGAAFVQKNFHHLIGDTIPQGWDTQIKTRWIINILAAKGYKTWSKNYNNQYAMDWTNHYGAQLGNNKIDTFANTMFTIGHNYIQNFNMHYPYLKEDISLINPGKLHHGFGYDFSLGITGEALAYSYILREAQHEGYNTQENNLNIILFAGTELFFGNNQTFSFFYQAQSPYDRHEKRFDVIGSFVYSYRF